MNALGRGWRRPGFPGRRGGGAFFVQPSYEYAPYCIAPPEFGAASHKKQKKGGAGALFSPGGSAAELWARSPTKRKVDVSGLFSPEDSIIAVARGMHPGVLYDMDARATIRGGLAVLKMAGVKGYTKTNVDRLKSTTLNTGPDDKALLKATGGGVKNLKDAAARIRGAVHKRGLGKAAWGARQLYVLENMKGFQVASGVSAAVVNVVPVVGQIVSAGVAGHMAISAAIAQKISEEAGKNIEGGLKAYKAKKAKAAAKKEAASEGPAANADAEITPPSGTAAEPPGETGPLAGQRKWLFLGGAAFLAVVIVLGSGGKKPATRAA